MAEIKDATIQNTMVKPRGLNICPLIPLISARGMNTTQVVTVPPMMDSRTAFVPSKAAFLASTKPPPFVFLKQLSSTTMELSTIIPTPRTRLDRVMTFREKPMAFIRIRAARMDTGMEVPTIRDAFMSPKNSQIMTMETTTAMIMVWNTLSRELEMDSLLSLMTTTSRAGSSAFRSSTIFSTSLDTSMLLLSWFFLMPRAMVSLPL